MTYSDKISKDLLTLAKKIQDSEGLLVADLCKKASFAASEFPHDTTIVSIANLLDRYNDSNKLVISKKDFKDLYNKYYIRNTKFAEYFTKELDKDNEIDELPKVSKAGQLEGNFIKDHLSKFGDDILKQHLVHAFGGEQPTGFSKEIADQAKKVVKSQMLDFSLKSDLKVTAGSENCIIIQASFETPKGLTSVLIPVEIKDKKVLIPNTFVSSSGVEDLNQQKLVSTIKKTAGSKLNIDSSTLLKGIESTKINKSQISDVELALVKLNSTKEHGLMASATSQVLGQKVDSYSKLEINLPEYKDEQFANFAEQFNSAKGIAAYKFGNDKVTLGRSLVSTKLKDLDQVNPQVTVIDSDEDQIIYAVALNGGNTSFRVPVKIKEGKVFSPEIMIANGSLLEISRDNLNLLNNESIFDSRASAVNSPVYGLKGVELLRLIQDAMSQNNYKKAEDALNVLRDGDDQKAYESGLAIYMSSLNNDNILTLKKASAGCKHARKTSTSTQLICGQTNLPVSKVYQDEYGNCLPESRRMNEKVSGNQGAYFLNHKIFF